QVIVVSMIDDSAVIKGIVGWVDHLERAEPRTDDRVIEKDAERVSLHRGAFSGANFNTLHARESSQDLIGADPSYDQDADKDDNSTEDHACALDATNQQKHKENQYLNSKTDDAPTRSRKEKRDDGSNGENSDKENPFATDFAEHQRNQGEGNDDF